MSWRERPAVPAGDGDCLTLQASGEEGGARR
jgi:hypothetical protein